MYAIRSYYAETWCSKTISRISISNRLKPKKKTNGTSRSPLKKNPLETSHLAAVVITSYSIHYTKLYEGRGIDQKNATHIFDPFFTTKSDGTGLGLSIIHRVVDTYDGMIDFESIPGKGTVFTLIFQNPHFKEQG